MLSLLSQWGLPILLTWLGFMGVMSLFWFRQRRKRKPGSASASGEVRLCGCHTRCDEHLYQITEPTVSDRAST